MNNKSIVFVVCTLDHGGIETYLTRIIPVLKRQGYYIQLWVMKKPKSYELINQIVEHCSIKFIPSIGGPFYYLWRIQNKSSELNISADLIVCTGSSTLLAAVNLLNGSMSKIICGIFSQYEFLTGPNYIKKIGQNLLKSLGSKNTFFCTDWCRISHAKGIDLELMRSHVSPLLIEINKGIKKDFKAQQLRILSIGRLVPFKNYNLYMIDIIQELVHEGINIVWTIVGDGPLKKEMVELVNKKQLNNNIYLIGQVQYKDLTQYYNNCDLYIGAGTTLIEASSHGIPSICTIDGEKNGYSPGFFCERDRIATSEWIPGENLYKIKGLIKEFYLNSNEYRYELSIKSFNKAKIYSLENAYNEYRYLIENSKNISLNLPRYFWLKIIISKIIFVVFKGGFDRYGKDII